ncbi:PfkB family carbohydrate kinase [Dactylosporangium sp. AC04546]|uniref:carbohydrate kinase family protein n=1 Tax=Dactylosporangium sp. AC04546 TaxID=2862460 RepID=UPI001EDCAF04|nr:PfkB family carbohydrate kinase [Dactylosporangium sp. AC04546]WVK88154.1 PfkB family carbohydrate kinase [Dactylosporangium sp. AC04546]
MRQRLQTDVPNVLIAGPVAWNLLVYVDELPRPEPHTVFAARHHETLGGTSAGKALNLSRLGIDVTLATLLGDDESASRIRAALAGPGIELLATPSANGSERHVNLMDRHGSRLSVYLTLPVPSEPATVPSAVLEAADAVVADLADHSRLFLRAARAAGKPIWCDLHDYDGESDFHREFAEAADYVFVSDERLRDPSSFLRERVAAGASLAVCTHGARGATALARVGTPIHVEATRVEEVVDTNGAGDAFFAGFLAAHLRGAPLEECLRQASRAGALAVSTSDLAPLYLTEESLRS